MSGGEVNAVEEFAAWLRQMKLLGGDLSLRELERRTQAVGPRVARSTIQDALDARRLPSLDHAVAMVWAMTGSKAAVEDCRTRWRRARSAVRGWELPDMPAPAAVRPAPSKAEASLPPPVASPPEQKPPWWRSRAAAVTGASITLLALAGAGIYLATAHGSGAGEKAPRTPAVSAASPRTPAPSPAYTPVYTHRNLSSHDYNDYFDLLTGKVVTDEGAWSLSTNADPDGDSHGAFELQPLTDAYLAGRTVPTVEQCATGLAHRPTRTVRFPAVPPGSSFCLRNRTTGDIAVVQVNDLDYGNWAADIFLSYYKHTSATTAPAAG